MKSFFQGNFHRASHRIPPLHIGTFIGILHLLIGLLGAGVITTFALYFIYKSGEHAILHEVETLAFITESALEEPISAYMSGAGSAASIESVLSRYLKSRPEIQYTILSTNGDSLLSESSSCSLTEIQLNSPEIELANANSIGHSIRNCATGERMIYVASKIDLGSDFFGFLILAAPLNEAMAPTYQTMRWMGVIALLIVAFTVGEGWLGSIYISRPLTRLSRTAEKLSQGDLTARAKVEGPVEVSHLAQTLNEMAARLQDSLDSLRAFVANASHELRTPLTSIKLQVNALRDGAYEEPEVANRFLNQLDHEIDRLSYTLNDMLDLSQIEGTSVQTIHPVNLIDLASEVEAFWESRSRQAKVSLSMRAEKDLFSVRGDPYRLRRLFDNLLDNAVKNTPAGGSIEIRLKNYPVGEGGFRRSVRVEIRDSGIGIAPEHLSHIFDRFYRIDPHPRGGGGGSGLGLAIARSIVIAHGGKIGVNSALGSGTTFWIELPAV